MGCASSADIAAVRQDLAAVREQNEALLALLQGGQPPAKAAPATATAAAKPNTAIAKATGKPASRPDAYAPEAPKAALPMQVMISLNVASMLPTALRFKAWLEARGVGVWVCTEMDGGIDFRDAIVDAVDGCRAFVPLINEEWALSAECEAEFQYAFRKNLTSKEATRQPVILPVCFPNLRWNAHKHVRLLLASTNALVYTDDSEEKESKLLAALGLSLKRAGVEFADSNLQTWETEKVCAWLQSILLRPVKEGHVTGEKLMAMSDQDFMKTLGLSQLHVEMLREVVPEPSSSAAAAAKSGAESKNTPLASAAAASDPYSGIYKIIARTINDNDGNITNSNEFLVFMKDGGISSSGCVWSAGSMHANYDGVTCVWQGTYSPATGQFHYTARYSNDTREEYAGSLDKDGFIVKAKYAWWGYGRQSYGSLDAVLQRLSAAEEEQAMQALQQMLEKGEDRLHNLQSIGKPLSWDALESIRDEHLAARRSQTEASATFVGLPAAGTAIKTGQAFAVHFKRPAGANASSKKEWIGLCRKGENNAWTRDAWFTVWNNRLEHGHIMYAELVPPSAGEYELVYFKDNNEPLARHPIQIVE